MMADILKLFKDYSMKWHWYHSVKLRPLVSIVSIVEDSIREQYIKEIRESIVETKKHKWYREANVKRWIINGGSLGIEQ